MYYLKIKIPPNPINVWKNLKMSDTVDGWDFSLDLIWKIIPQQFLILQNKDFLASMKNQRGNCCPTFTV